MRHAVLLLGAAPALALALTFAASAHAQQAAPTPTLPPGPSEPPPPPPPGSAGSASPSIAGAMAPSEVRYEPSEPGVALMARAGTERVRLEERRFRRIRYYETGLAPVYSPMCAGPCSLTLPPGEYDLALSIRGGPAVHPNEPVVIQGPSTLRGEYVDRSGLRTAGTVIGIAGVAGGAVMIVVAVGANTSCDTSCHGGTFNGGLLAGGIVALVAGALAGSVLALQHDSARIYVTPLSLAPARELGANGPAEGAMVGVRF